MGADNGRDGNLLYPIMKGTQIPSLAVLSGKLGGFRALGAACPGAKPRRVVHRMKRHRPATQSPPMLKTVVVLGVLALLAIFALKLLFVLLGFAIPALLLGFLIYGVLVVFAPERAARLKARIAEI